MSEQQSNKKTFAEKLKAMKLNRSAVVGGCVLAAAVVIISAVAIASNRAKQNVGDDDTDTPITVPDEIIVPTPEETTPPAVTEQPSSTPETTPSTPVEDTLPSFVLPVSGALFKKHDPSLQVSSNTMNDYRVHLGIDIVTSESAPVYAAADGTVDKIWSDVRMGYCLAIKHSGDCYTIYKNLAEVLPEGIAEGVSVRSGQLIASVGESAMVEIADEPHLHFEMTVADLGVDPLEYFDENALASLGIDASHEN